MNHTRSYETLFTKKEFIRNLMKVNEILQNLKKNNENLRNGKENIRNGKES